MLRILALILAFIAAPLAAQDLETMSAAEREIFRAEVRAYLLDSPEVLMEAIAVLENRQAEAEQANDVFLARSNADALFNDGYSYVGGNPEGDITLVEFIDYRCAFCRRAHPEVAALLAADGNIRLIIKEFPILGDASTASARFAIAVRNTVGFEVYHEVGNALIALRGEPSPEALSQMAIAFGLDRDVIFEAMNAPEVDAEIADVRLLAQQLQISGTPTFVFDDQMVRGYAPLAQMQQVVASIRSE